MKTFVHVLCLGGLLVGAPLPAGARLNVVTTLPDFAALAAEIGGAQVKVTSLATPTEDPHFVDPKPSFIRALNQADVLIEGGAELESGWLPPLLNSARNPKIQPGGAGYVTGIKGIDLLEVPATLDRSQGDIHAAGNPHYLLDPVNALILATNVTETFCRLDAASADLFQANLAKFSETLRSKLAEWQRQLAPFQGRQVVSYHNSWPYLARRFNLKFELHLEPKPGLPPTPSHLAEVMAAMKKENVCVIFAEPYLNRKTAETMARHTGAVVVDVAYFPGGVKGTEGSYVKLMDYLVNSLVKAFPQR